jgi:hypothetical protein
MLFDALTLRGIRLGLALVVAALLLGAPGVTHAEGEDPETIDKITALNKKALDLYNDLDFEEARKVLKQALDLCGSAGLDKHPIAARTHIHMGVVLIAAKQQELGVKQFKKALEIQPDIQVTKALANPEILQAFKDAAAMGNEGGAPEPGGEATPSGPAPGGAAAAPEPANASGVGHTPISRGKRGKPITVIATVGADVTGYTKVVVGYRAEGAPEFLERDMVKSGNKYVGEIPADATQGNLVSYYIEAQSEEAEDALAASGSEDKPYKVSLSAAGEAEGGEGGGGKEKAACEGDDCEDEDAGPPFYVALMGGIGFGLATGNGEVNTANKVSPGFALASLAQIAPEIGYFLTPDFRLSLEVRYQFVSGTTPLDLDKLLAPTDPKIGSCGADHRCVGANYALAAFARGTWFFGSGLFRPYFSLAVGGGNIRHVVKLSSLGRVCGQNGDQLCVDTVASGPVFAGPGGGVLLAFAPSFGVVIDVNSVLGFPKLTYHVDVDAGVAVRF